MKKGRRVVRAGIVKAAARKLGKSVHDFFVLAANGVLKVKVSLNKIPEFVVAFAKKILKSKHPARPPAKSQQRYYRTGPFMSAC